MSKYTAIRAKFKSLTAATGRPLVTEAATFANVHRSTVSKMLNDDTYINDPLALKLTLFITQVENDEAQLRASLKYLLEAEKGNVPASPTLIAALRDTLEYLLHEKVD